jgi:hypothetical protein
VPSAGRLRARAWRALPFWLPLAGTRGEPHHFRFGHFK